MPTYDFICNDCTQRFEVFLTFSEYGKKTVKCVHCHSKNVRRRMTKVRVAKSEESRMDSMADEFSGFEGMEDDPQAMGRMMRKMGKGWARSFPLSSMKWWTGSKKVKAPRRSKRRSLTWGTPTPVMMYEHKCSCWG